MKKINCKLFGHKLVKTSYPNAPIKEYTCKCCKKEFTKDGYGAIVFLDAFWRENNKNLRTSFLLK